MYMPIGLKELQFTRVSFGNVLSSETFPPVDIALGHVECQCQHLSAIQDTFAATAGLVLLQGAFVLYS